MTDTTLDHEPSGRRGGSNVPIEIRVKAMTDELARGRARYLSATITDFVQYRGAWWILDRELWFVVDDEELIVSLNSASEMMADASIRGKSSRHA
ncbi:hypothetical protein [Streptacidiphilus sp. MAP5-3]|uniref:hypothetical protein n=1 Tax=unclassified Streptacidiphilus TaxID=2643834 RepID=UPI0035167F1A